MDTTGDDELQNGRGYPRPQLCRDDWHSLDGTWQFAIDENALWIRPDEVKWDRTIRVPFSPETRASGVAQTGFFRACWYRRGFRRPDVPSGHRVLLHFAPVDHDAPDWSDGLPVG